MNRRQRAQASTPSRLRWAAPSRWRRTRAPPALDRPWGCGSGAHDCASRGWPDADRRQRRYVGRERVLFSTRERILSGDLRMLRAPSDPPELREGDRRDRFLAVEVELDLIALST